MHRSKSLPLVVLSLAAAVFPCAAGSGNAFGPFTIKIEIEGVTQGVFHSVEGLVSESEVVASPAESADNQGVEPLPVYITPPIQSPGALKPSRLILKRPFDPLLSGLWHWRQSAIDGSPVKRDGHIFIFNNAGMIVSHWVFQQGWPCRWQIPVLMADAATPSEEVVEIVHSGLSMVMPEGS